MDCELRRTWSNKGRTDKFPPIFNPKIVQEKDRLETLAIDKNKILELMIF
jgi:hypothetical protein